MNKICKFALKPYYTITVIQQMPFIFQKLKKKESQTQEKIMLQYLLLIFFFLLSDTDTLRVRFLR